MPHRPTTPATTLGTALLVTLPTLLPGQTPPPQTGAQAAAQPAAATAAPAAPAAAPVTPGTVNRVSWASDRRAFAVGDLITVLVDDYTISSAIKEHIATDQRTRDLSANASLPPFSRSAGVGTRNGANETQRGTARRENRFQNELSVRVVAIEPNGLLKIRGTKMIDVDRQKQDVELTGVIRPHDISVTNVIQSARIADAQVTYASPGSLGKPKQGLVTKVVGLVWP